MKRFLGVSLSVLALSFATVVGAELDEHRNRLAVAEYVETLEKLGKNKPEQVKDILDATFSGYLQCYAQRNYLLNQNPGSNKAPQFKSDRDILLLNFMYLANAIEDLGMAKSSDILDGFRPAVDRSYKQAGGLYERSKNNGSSVASDELLEFVEYCNHWVGQARSIELEVNYKIELEKIMNE